LKGSSKERACKPPAVSTVSRRGWLTWAICRYDIVEVPYVEPSGVAGIALACGENIDANMLDGDMQTHSFGGRLWHYNEQTTRMPAVAQVVVDDAVLLEKLQQAQKCRFDATCDCDSCANTLSSL